VSTGAGLGLGVVGAATVLAGRRARRVGGDAAAAVSLAFFAGGRRLRCVPGTGTAASVTSAGRAPERVERAAMGVWPLPD
jgi:hypothetical protein